VTALTNYFRDYIHEIILVNDNSRDRTADVAGEIARQYRRVRVINRKPPNGVGRALRDGYAAATGDYILTMDSDFVQLSRKCAISSTPLPKDMTEPSAAGSRKSRSWSIIRSRRLFPTALSFPREEIAGPRIPRYLEQFEALQSRDSQGNENYRESLRR